MFGPRLREEEAAGIRGSRPPIIRTVSSFNRGEAWRVDEKGK